MTTSEPPPTFSAPQDGKLLAELSALSIDEPMEILLIADVHLTTTDHGTWKVLHRTEEKFIELIEYLTEFDGEMIVFLGDQTHGGHPSQNEAFNEHLQSINTPYCCIPGNHDAHVAADGVGSGASTVPPHEEFPIRQSVNDLDIILLDSARSPDGELDDTWGGIISDAQLEWLDTNLPECPNPIVCLHHNLAPLPEHTQEYPWENFPVRNSSDVIDVLTRHDVPLAFSGHHHLPAVDQYGDLTEVIAPALCSFPPGFLRMTVDEDGTSIYFESLATIGDLDETYKAAVNGNEIGQGVVKMAMNRWSNLPLYRE